MTKYSPLCWIAKNDLTKSVLQERRINYLPVDNSNIRPSRKKFIPQNYVGIGTVILLIRNRSVDKQEEGRI